MQIYKTTDNSKSILPFDLFEMLGLEDMTKKEKKEFEKQVTKLMLQYFLQEKIGERLTEAEKEEIANIGVERLSDAEKIIEVVGDKVNEAPQLLTEAMIEVKVRVVRDHYQNKKRTYEKKLEVTKDIQEIDAIQKKIIECNSNLQFIKEEKWELVASQVAEK